MGDQRQCPEMYFLLSGQGLGELAVASCSDTRGLFFEVRGGLFGYHTDRIAICHSQYNGQREYCVPHTFVFLVIICLECVFCFFFFFFFFSFFIYLFIFFFLGGGGASRYRPTTKKWHIQNMYGYATPPPPPHTHTPSWLSLLPAIDSVP